MKLEQVIWLNVQTTIMRGRDFLQAGLERLLRRSLAKAEKAPVGKPITPETMVALESTAWAWRQHDLKRVGDITISDGWQNITIAVPGRRFAGPLCPARARMRADDPTCPTAWKCKGEGCALPIWIGIDLAGPNSDHSVEIEVRR